MIIAMRIGASLNSTEAAEKKIRALGYKVHEIFG